MIYRVVRYFTEYDQVTIKELFIKLLIMITTEPFSCGGKDSVLITDDILEVVEIWKLLFRECDVYDLRCCVRTFEELISLIEKNLLSFSLCTSRHV